MDIDSEDVQDRVEAVVRSRAFLIGVGLFVAAFAVRWVFHQHGFWIDEGRALMIAKNVLAGEGFRHSPGGFMFKHPAVFYTLIAVSYLFLGVTALAGMVTTNVLASLTVVAVYLTGRELFNEWAGVAAGVLMLVAPIHMFLSTRILTDAPVTFFVALTLYFWARTEQRGERWSFYAMFVAGGLTVLTKLSGIVVLPAMFVYYLWKEREAMFMQRKYWIGAGTVVGMYGLWEVRNLLTVGFLGIGDVFLNKYLNIGAASSGGGGGGAGFLSGAVFHLTHLPETMGVPGTLLLAAGFVAAYIYRDDRMAIPAVYLAVALTVLSAKTLNRYFLPFIPMAMVVAGYGVDRIRALAASYEARAGDTVFVLVLLASGVFMFQAGAAMTTSSAQGFVGLEEAGKWIDQTAPEDAVVIAGSGHQIRFFSDRDTIHAGTIANRSEFYRILTERNVQYVEVDRWESTQPEWYLRIVQRSDAFQPVRGVGPQDRPWVMVYRVNPGAIG